MGLEFGPRKDNYEMPTRHKIALGAVLIGSLYGLYELNNSEESREESIEACVSELVGRDINLDVNPKTGMLQRPASVYDEVTACLKSNGDTQEAKIIIDE